MKFGGTYHWQKAYSNIACHLCLFWPSRTFAKRYYQQKSMQIMQYDLQNAVLLIQDLSLFTGWSQLFYWFLCKTIGNSKVLPSYQSYFSSLGILNKVTNSSLQCLGTNKNIVILIIKKVKDASIPNVDMWQQLSSLTKITFLGILYLFLTV